MRDEIDLFALELVNSGYHIKYSQTTLPKVIGERGVLFPLRKLLLKSCRDRMNSSFVSFPDFDDVKARMANSVQNSSAREQLYPRRMPQ